MQMAQHTIVHGVQYNVKQVWTEGHLASALSMLVQGVWSDRKVHSFPIM
jgi:hypothetical protein